MTDPTPMTGPQHVQEALRLSDLAQGQNSELAQCNLIRAQVHAILANTAAMVDKRRYNDGSEVRDHGQEDAWHRVFAVGR